MNILGNFFNVQRHIVLQWVVCDLNQPDEISEAWNLQNDPENGYFWDVFAEKFEFRASAILTSDKVHEASLVIKNLLLDKCISFILIWSSKKQSLKIYEDL